MFQDGTFELILLAKFERTPSENFHKPDPLLINPKHKVSPALFQKPEKETNKVALHIEANQETWRGLSC